MNIFEKFLKKKIKEELINEIIEYGNISRIWAYVHYHNGQKELDKRIEYIKEIIDELCKDANNVRPEKPCCKCTCESST